MTLCSARSGLGVYRRCALTVSTHTRSAAGARRQTTMPIIARLYGLQFTRYETGVLRDSTVPPGGGTGPSNRRGCGVSGWVKTPVNGSSCDPVR
eukprot:515832-Prymnesium_polylepis.1